MIGRTFGFWRHFLSAGLVVFLLAFPTLAQEDSNPDSPTPILLSEKDSTRALATKIGKSYLTKNRNRAFYSDSKILLYVSNIDLKNEEGASSLRVYVEDAKGRKYRFPVLSVEPVQGQEWIYAITVHLKDELGFWDEPILDGDVLVGVSWRGLTSNRVRVGIGKTGGDIKDDAGAIPTPAPAAPLKKTSEAPETKYVGFLHSGDRKRFMEQATFGPTPTLDARLRRIGLTTWLAEQFEEPYPTNPYPNFILKPNDAQLGCPRDSPEYAVCIRDYYSMYPVQNWFFKEALYGNAQLKHRVAWSLGQMWVISGVDTQQSSHMITYHQVLSKNSFDNYRNLMTEMTLNPGMGNYLDMVRSTKNNPNENFAREILQLFSIGLFMLNQDGTLQLDGSGNPIPSYDQETVNNFTKVFTGWTLCENTALCPNRTTGAPNYKDPMLLIQNNHDTTAKTLLSYPGAVNTNIAPNLNGTTELHQALDNIFYHPNVAPFVSRFLIQHLVTSDPTPAYVGRVAAVFNNNNSNVRGDLKSVVRAILLDPEARGNVKTDPNYGKLREPVQLATNILRQFGARSANGAAQSDGYINQIIAPMGQNTFNSPTVFNYYTPDYIIPGTALNGPEFGILTTGTAIARANFVNTIVFGRVNVGSLAPLGTSINLTEMQALAAGDPSSNLLLDTLNQKLMHGTMSAQMKNTILTAVQAVPSTTPLVRAQTAIYLIATSSQYQVQR
jgi:hypothetical protein